MFIPSLWPILRRSRKLSEDKSSFSHLTWTMPITELHMTMVNILGILVLYIGLLSWQIFYDKSSNIWVKIRFGNGHCDPTTERQPCKSISTYRRKSPSQVRRNHVRIAAHKDGNMECVDMFINRTTYDRPGCSHWGYRTGNMMITVWTH